MAPDSALPARMVSALHPTKVLVDPFGALTPVIDARRWVWPLLLLMLSGALGAAAFASRWDARPSTLRQLEEEDALAQTTELELSEKVQTAERVKLVVGVLKAVVVAPLAYLLLAVFLKITAWLFGKKALFARTFSAVATATLPISLYNLAYTLCALRQPSLADDAERTLVPSSLAALVPSARPPLLGLLLSIDFFNLWSVGLLALGFAAAAQLSRPRALALLAVLYAMYIGVFMIGLPAMSGGPGGHGGRP